MGTGGRRQCCCRSGNRRAVGPAFAATILVLLAGLPAQGEVPPELLRLSRIKTEASRTLERLADYTCEVLVERGHVGRKAREKLLNLVCLEYEMIGDGLYRRAAMFAQIRRHQLSIVESFR